MSGKVVLLTGASSGIGREAAIELARGGAELTIVCHTPERAVAACKEIQRRSGASSVRALSAELFLLSETRRVAREFAASHSRLDVLVNNAGSNFPSYATTADGFERTMALNYFSPFLLTHLLLPQLKASVPSRVVNVASVAHFSGRLQLDRLRADPEMGVGGLAAYARSKLALVLFTLEMARRLEGSGVTVNCLHPGAVRTNIWSHAGAYTPLTRFGALFMRSPKKGARTTVYLSTAPEVARVSGKYFVDSQERPPSRSAKDPELARKLFELTLAIVGLGAAEGPTASSA